MMGSVDQRLVDEGETGLVEDACANISFAAPREIFTRRPACRETPGGEPAVAPFVDGVVGFGCRHEVSIRGEKLGGVSCSGMIDEPPTPMGSFAG